MSEDIEHPGPATSPFDAFLDRLPDEPSWCARQAMPEPGHGRWWRMADLIASRRWPAPPGA
jgi:hypothetical protein